MSSTRPFDSSSSRTVWLVAAASVSFVVLVGFAVARAGAETVPLPVAGGTWMEAEGGPRLVGTAFAFNPGPLIAGGPDVEIRGPAGWNAGQSLLCGLFQPPGMASNRSTCWAPVLPLEGDYTARTSFAGDVFERTFHIDPAERLGPPEITELVVSRDEVSSEWAAPANAGSFMIRMNPVSFAGDVDGEAVVSKGSRQATLGDLLLEPGERYQAVVWAFSDDVWTPGALADPFNIGSDNQTFTVRTENDHERLTPAAFWSFNDCRTGGGRLRDASPGRHHLQLGQAQCGRGRYGQGLRLERGPARRTARNVLHFAEELTVSAWVLPVDVSGTRPLVHRWLLSRSFRLFIRKGQLVFAVALDDDGEYAVSAPVVADRWTQVTGVFDGIGKTIRIYVDGERRDRLVLETDEPVLRSSSAPVSIGSFAFRGTVDEVGLYDAAFARGEVWSLAGRNESLYFGSDTFVYPGRGTGGALVKDRDDEDEMGFDFYLGRLGRWLDGYRGRPACRIGDYAGKDILAGGGVDVTATLESSTDRSGATAGASRSSSG